MGEKVSRLFRETMEVVARGSRQQIALLRRAEAEVDVLHSAIIAYLGKLSLANLVEPQPQKLYQSIAIANYLENLGDVIDNNLLDDATRRVELGVAISPSTMAVLTPIHNKVCWAFDRALEALQTGDAAAAADAVKSKAEVGRLADEATAHLARRLTAHEPHRLEAFQVETDIIENLKRLNTLTRRIARLAVQVEGLADAPETATAT